ncbi:hypothetical protein GJ744_008741 [Endocarpon pusillum]|uniref:aminodeoxychorismate synthase n=1 Tax=Endocarpon pusillum TaxID=364733 RepID=A0A8H7E8R4_9EURO|nr:hypothetical protein GJ744_008741 [Endocarpon pusillum]
MRVVSKKIQFLDSTSFVGGSYTDSAYLQMAPKSNHALYLQNFDAVVLGPGPGNPEATSDVGLFSQIWRLPSLDVVPVLGICLGFQSLCIAYGASIRRMLEPCHGHAKGIKHCDEDIFNNVGEVIATNYNSLEVELGDNHSLAEDSGPTSSSPSVDSGSSSPSTVCTEFYPSQPEFEPSLTCPKLRPLAWDDFGTLMSVKHVELPFWGLQFHPESCKSNAACQSIIKNWWNASMHWSTCARRAINLSRSKLLSGHVWSRPLTPIHIMAKPCDIAENHRLTATLQEELQALTASSAAIVECHTMMLPTSGGRVLELCRSLSQNDQAMLESTRKGRFNIYAVPGPSDFRLEYSLETSTCTLNLPDQDKMQWQMKLLHVLDEIQGLVARRRVKAGHDSVPFFGGFIGYFSYEVGLERLGVKQERRSAAEVLPDINLLWVERSIVIDHVSNEAHIQSIRKDDSTWMAETVAKLNRLSCPEPPIALRSARLQALLTAAKIRLPDEEIYKREIQACQDYLRSGDSYELCLTTGAQISLPTHPENSWLLYHNLRRHNPVPFSAFLRLGKTTILSSSPEQFLSWDRSSGSINMMPMKGTVAKSPCMNLAQAKEILASPKESAENLMIADLIRHDLYSTVGWNACVDVIKLCQVVEHETVYQLVSHIRATPSIPPTLSADERQQEIMRYGHKALRQTLPPGSMTGAPKKRSCEILRRLEQRRRGVYSGVLGYLDVGGAGAFSVCIRTAVSNAHEDRDGRQTWRVGAGGAITVLSDVDAEWEEMKTKLESVLRAFRPDG